MKREFRANIRVTEGGRIVIPAEVRQRLDLEVGTELVMTVEDDQATIMSAEAARRRAREMVRKYAKPGVSLSKQLMAERKKEAKRE